MTRKGATALIRIDASIVRRLKVRAARLKTTIRRLVETALRKHGAVKE